MPKTKATLTNRRCRCGNCGEHFSAISTFDRHRQGVHGKSRHCADPETLGMVIRETPGGTFWSMPGPDNAPWRIER